MSRHTSQSGFSLIELLVSITIFSIVITMATSTLLVLLDANSRAQNKQAILSNLTVAVDSMTREIRTGYNYYCGNAVSTTTTVEAITAVQDCSTGGNYISFIESGGDLTGGLTGLAAGRISYYFDDGEAALYRRIASGDWVKTTSNSIEITAAEFIVEGTGSGNTEQPNVTVFIEGTAGSLIEQDSDFVIQSSVTQRPIDI